METVQGVLAREHVIILRILDQLELALGARDWTTLGRLITFLSTQVPIHRNKEEEILFPMCRELLSREALAEVARKMEEIEREGDGAASG